LEVVSGNLMLVKARVLQFFGFFFFAGVETMENILGIIYPI
jgi:hypothetical protein